MMLTLIFTSFMSITFVVQTFLMNLIHENELSHFGDTISIHPGILKTVDEHILKDFCNFASYESVNMENALLFFEYLTFVYTFGMIANICQKLLVMKVK